MLEATSGCHLVRPVDEAFAVISDFEQNRAWQNGMVSCHFTTDPPLHVGSRYDQEAKFMGRSITSTFEVIEFVPGRSMKATSMAGTFPRRCWRSESRLGATVNRKLEIQGQGRRLQWQ